MTTSTKAWIILGAGVICYDLMAPAGQTLSEGARRAATAHPVAVRVGVGLLAAHVAALLPRPIDPIHLAFTAVRALFH